MSQKHTTTTIRPATAMDSVAIVRLIRAGYAETPAKHIGELDEQKLLEYVTGTLRHAFVVVADQGSGRVVGTLALGPIRVPWCNAVVMAESWFAVVEAHRAKGIPEQLLGAAEVFLDKNKLVGFLGTQMLTPASMNAVIAKRPGYVPSRQTFLRLPATALKKAVGG
jgi:GNAT superfamily N-acetyltransferase